ncbi:MAG TPA: helix-turn-helix transcriptional regulator [Pseudonocardiaceae bacterium]|nr:helix-turn-helix transcriptional regulator [Pseudonocardiaceae bacterium]
MTGATDHGLTTSPATDQGTPRGVPTPACTSTAATHTASTDSTESSVFSPGRLRAHRDLARLTRPQLATLTGLPVAVITGYETGITEPTTQHLAALARTLAVTPGELVGPPDAQDSWEYWALICAAMPPMTDEQITSVATVLRRIDQHDQPPP